MSAAAIAKRLAEAGLDASAIVAALEAFEAVEEERKAKTRERKRRQRSREETACPVTERDVTRQAVTERDTPYPLPPSPQTPQPPTPTPGEQSRTRKGRPDAKPDDLAERVWKAANQTSRDRSGRPKVARAVAEAVKAGASEAALVASVRSICGKQGEFAKGLHQIVEGQHWRDHVADRRASSAPPDPALSAHRQQHFAKTGEWRAEWGPRPPIPANDPSPIAEGRRA